MRLFAICLLSRYFYALWRVVSFYTIWESIEEKFYKSEIKIIYRNYKKSITFKQIEEKKLINWKFPIKVTEEKWHKNNKSLKKRKCFPKKVSFKGVNWKTNRNKYK